MHFEIEGRTLHAHQMLLKHSRCTDVFGAMLRHDTSHVPIKDVSFETFSLLIKYLYTGTLHRQETAARLLELFRAARRWLVKPLAELCATRLVAPLNSLDVFPPASPTQWEQLWELLQLLAEDEGGNAAAKTLQDAAGNFMLRRIEALVEQPRFVERRAELAALLLECTYPAQVQKTRTRARPRAGGARAR